MKRNNTDYIQYLVEEILEQEWERALRLFPKFTGKYYQVKFVKVGQYAGRCTMIKCHYGSANLTFNQILFHENKDQITDIVIHELCHFIATNLTQGNVHHGMIWKSCMRRMGVNPEVYHNMNTASTKRKTTKYIYTCNACGEEIKFSGIRHKKMKQYGTQFYGHKNCKRGEGFSFTGKVVKL